MHKLVAQEFIDNPDNTVEVDHIDNNRHNNCINNLRWATRCENQENKRKQQKPCSSIFKGVYYHKQHQKWRAQIQGNTGQKHIGYFDSERDAALAYNSRALLLFGEFANLNNISDIASGVIVC